MAAAWLITLPSAGIVGAITYFIVHLIGGYPGAIVGFLLLVGCRRRSCCSRVRRRSTTQNVNATSGKAARRRAPAAKAPAGKPRPRRRHLERPTNSECLVQLHRGVQILVAGLLVGAGLPALFALAVRMNAEGLGCRRPRRRYGRARKPLLSTISWLIFGLVLLAVIIGVLFIARDFIGHHTGLYILGAKQK